MNIRAIVLLLLTITATAIGNIAFAESLRISTWNVKEGSVENLLLRSKDLSSAGKKIRPDILIAQELGSFASAQLLADRMGMSDTEIAVSNFGSDAEIIYFGFETAVISKVPFVKVEEWQQRVFVRGKEILDPNGPIIISSDGKITALRSDESHELVVPKDIIVDAVARESGVSRGVLRVELENGLVIYPVHLKSNLARLCGMVGRELSTALRTLDKIGKALPVVKAETEEAIQVIRGFSRGNANPNSISRKAVQEQTSEFVESYVQTAQNRENAAAFIAKMVKIDLDAGKTVIVAGDFNTPIFEPSKTGSDLSEDCVPTPWSCGTKLVENSCGNKDGFDDTLHILSGDVVPGVRLLPLFTKAERTHIKDGFAESPIDNMFIAGPLASQASAASKVVGAGDPAFGSDHFPLVMTIEMMD